MKLYEVDNNAELNEAITVLQELYTANNKHISFPAGTQPSVRDLVLELNDPLLTHISNIGIIEFINYGRKWIKFNDSNKDVFSNKTGLPTYDDMIRDPEYFNEKKNTVFKIAQMSPDEYKLHAEDGFSEKNFTPEQDLIFKYALKVLDGSKMPLGLLEYELTTHPRRGTTYTSFMQEGRHRAVVAKLLNVKSIPVMIVAKLDTNVDNSEKSRFFNEIFDKFS